MILNNICFVLIGVVGTLLVEKIIADNMIKKMRENEIVIETNNHNITDEEIVDLILSNNIIEDSSEVKKIERKNGKIHIHVKNND